MDPHPLAQPLARAIAAALPETADIDVDAIRGHIAPPPNPKLGDLCFPCFPLTGPLGQKNPAKLAADLVARISCGEGQLITAIKPTGPYLNFKLDMGVAGDAVISPWLRNETPDLRAINPLASERVMVEFSQPNTHKAFHVGHLRNVCLGDALVRILRATGHEVVAANYFGDVGTHIAKCLWAYEQLEGEEAIIPDTGRGEWLGRIYAKGSTELSELEEAGQSDPEKLAAYGAARARMSEILHGIESRSGAMHELWTKTRQWSLDEFAEIYNWCQVGFDRLFYESEVDQPSLELVDEYHKKGVFIDSEGAVGIVNEEIEHMPFFMLRKRDGTGLYGTKDLALAKLKFDEFAIDRSIYVVDVRQSDHFRHVFATLAKMGFSQAEACVHVPYEMVELTTGPMAGRSGTVVLFRQLERELTQALVERFEKYRGDWSDEEIDEKAHQVALGAIKYGMLNRDVNQKIIFDMQAWLQFEGNTGPYLQYVTARTNSIVAKCAAKGKVLQHEALQGPRALEVFSALGEPTERALVVMLAGLARVVAQAGQQLRPSVLCTYLFELAQAYNRFQNQCRVIDSEGDLLQARLALVAASRRALVWGLDLIGIPAPERM